LVGVNAIAGITVTMPFLVSPGIFRSKFMALGTILGGVELAMTLPTKGYILVNIQ
jgi:hypothetical protein